MVRNFYQIYRYRHGAVGKTSSKGWVKAFGSTADGSQAHQGLGALFLSVIDAIRLYRKEDSGNARRKSKMV